MTNKKSDSRTIHSDGAKLYNDLVKIISSVYVIGKGKAINAVNAVLVETYWNIGKHIVEFEQEGKVKASYGDKLLSRLSADLSLQFGKGFSVSNLIRFRQFYINYTIDATVSHQFEKGDKEFEICATVSHKLKTLCKKISTLSSK